MISRSKFLLLLLLGIIYTISIILISVSIKDYIDTQKFNYLNYKYKYEILDMDAYSLYCDYLTLWEEKNESKICEYKNQILKNFDIQLKALNAKLSLYAPSSSIFKEMYFDYLKRKDYLIQLKEYYVASKLMEKCDNTTLILFFFKREDDDSKIMGKVLSEVSAKLNNTYVIPFDIEYKDISILTLIKKQFNITTTDAPVFILNNKYVFKGVYKVDEVIDLITKYREGVIY